MAGRCEMDIFSSPSHSWRSLRGASNALVTVAASRLGGRVTVATT